MSTHERPLLVLAAQLGLDPSGLDEVVHEVHSQAASAVNNGGIDRQICFLLQHLAPDDVEQEIRGAAVAPPPVTPRSESCVQR